MIINCNDAAEILLEKSKEEIIGQHQTSVHPPGKAEYYANMFKSHIEQKRIVNDEAMVITKSGKIIQVHITASVTLIGGEPVIQGIFRDITERKKALQKLKESEEKYRLITESISDPLHVVDAELKIIYQNSAFIEWLKALGLNHEIIGKTPAEAFPFIGEKATKEYHEVFNSKKEHFLEDSMVLNNKRIFTETKKIPVLNDGKVIQIITIVRDVTERKEAEFKLKESEEKYRNLVETSSMGLLELDIRKGRGIYINPRLLEIVGYTQEELLSNGMFYRAIYPDDYKKVTKSDEDKDIEFRIINKEGRIKWLSGRTLHHYNEQGKLVYLRLWLQDITERKELEEIKSNLLTRISHEFKTPLISIKGFTDLVLSEYAENLDYKIISFLERIKDGGNKLKSLINTFLESTQLDKEYVELNLNQENLSLLIRSSLEQMEGVINMREHTVDLNIHDVLTSIFDKERIESVFTNLLLNAIYYTPKGGNISIQSNIKGKSIIISVKDNGIGLTKKEISKLFEPFGKIERYGKRWDIISEGMGMGLHISKEIIDLHDGKIWAESDGINKGSKFSFSIPIVKN
ncbi:MAG: PAS domain-containing sensor histidine kinase [Candidatus Lokiarchaeota archaeon]|nr:PAS domain-containing sensor histidine kinase [Candidatus Lokiarchaeota archaeon]